MSESNAVAIIVPVLNRPHRVQLVMDSVAEATPEPYRLLFVASRNDRPELAALDEAGADYVTVPMVRRTYAKKINSGYRATTEPFLFSAADDVHFHKDWLPNAMRLMVDGICVVGTNDLQYIGAKQGWHSTHSLFRRSYADEQGTIDQPRRVLNEGYQHAYCDLEFTETARARGVYAHALDSVVEHIHHKNGKRPLDSTDQLARRAVASSKAHFKSRKHLWRNMLAEREDNPAYAFSYGDGKNA